MDKLSKDLVRVCREHGLSVREASDRIAGVSKSAVGREYLTLGDEPSIETNFIIGDLHIPFHDRRAVDIALEVCEDVNPNEITILGDLCDMYGISTHTKMQTSVIADEIAAVRAFLRRLRSRFPTQKITWIAGNHEYRFDRFIAMKASELRGLRGLTLEEQVDPRGLADIEFVYSGTRASYSGWNGVLLGHWDKVSKYSAYTAKNLLSDCSLVQGHTHRLGSHYRRGTCEQYIAVENGCLCTLSPSWTLDPDWQQGFTILHCDPKTSTNFFEQVQIHSSRFGSWALYKGKMYERWEVSKEDPRA